MDHGQIFTPPPRISAPTEGRNSISYNPFNALQDTTHIYLIDNKSSDIESLNLTNNQSNFFTNIIQNADFSPSDAATQDIKLDSRSRWGGQLKTMIKTNAPNATEYFNSNMFRARLMVDKTNPDNPVFKWFDLTIPEGNYTTGEIIDLMNNAIVENYLTVGRQHGVEISDIGVKFDTRNFALGLDPLTGLVTPGKYTYKAFHPDIVLLPDCGVDFTTSRLSNMLGIRKRLPYEGGFRIMYRDLTGGNIPALLDLSNYPTETVPLLQDLEGNTYHVSGSYGKWFTAYRSWYLAYNTPKSEMRNYSILTVPDVTGGIGQIYWSLPDMYKPPITFSNNTSSAGTLPVVGMTLFPTYSKPVLNTMNVYAQLVEQMTNATKVFNRFPKNEILVQAPYETVTYISENVPLVTDHGIQPLRSSLTGVQRVTITDDRRRPCPYVVKSLATVTPKVLSSATLQ